MSYASKIEQLIAERDALREALSFYADPSRYHGPNQRMDKPDKWSDCFGLTAYRLDVTRDQGLIARAALDSKLDMSGKTDSEQ